MSKREEIRKGMSYKIIELVNALDESPDKETSRRIWDNFFLDLFEYLHSQGVVIKVDRKLPYSKYVDGIFNSRKKSQAMDYIEKNAIYEDAQLDMLKVGFAVVESLIEVK